VSELPSHGTGWSETEVLLDVVEVYNTWDGNSTPDFSTAQERLRERFTTPELIALDAIAASLHQLIEAERMRRIEEAQASASSQPS